jgi:hypothetical protein
MTGTPARLAELPADLWHCMAAPSADVDGTVAVPSDAIEADVAEVVAAHDDADAQRT